MSRHVHLAPLALACDGTVLVNLAEFAGLRTLKRLMRTAREQRGLVFVGIELRRDDLRRMLPWFRDGCSEASARIVGPRERRSRSSKSKR